MLGTMQELVQALGDGHLKQPNPRQWWSPYYQMKQIFQQNKAKQSKLRKSQLNAETQFSECEGKMVSSFDDAAVSRLHLPLMMDRVSPLNKNLQSGDMCFVSSFVNQAYPMIAWSQSLHSLFPVLMMPLSSVVETGCQRSVWFRSAKSLACLHKVLHYRRGREL